MTYDERDKRPSMSSTTLGMCHNIFMIVIMFATTTRTPHLQDDQVFDSDILLQASCGGGSKSPSVLNRRGLTPAHQISILPQLPKYTIEIQKSSNDFLGNVTCVLLRHLKVYAYDLRNMFLV